MPTPAEIAAAADAIMDEMLLSLSLHAKYGATPAVQEAAKKLRTCLENQKAVLVAYSLDPK